MGQIETKRISWIDMAKGYGTLLVIYAHIGSGLLRSWMYSFHLPLFFFLSGYVFSTKYDFKTFLKKKCSSIVVPYFCLGIPMVLFELLLQLKNGQFRIENAMHLLKQLVLQQRLWTLWYIAGLFCLNILFYGILKLCKREWMIVVTSIILPVIGLCYYGFGGAALFWNVDVCLMAIPFFAVGYLYKMHNEQVDGFIKERLNATVLFYALGVVNIVSWILSLDHTGVGLEMFYSKYGNPIFTYVSAFAGIFCVVLFSKKFVLGPIRYLGENSMLYYAWHQTIMIPVMEKVLAVVGLTALQWHGLLGGFAYKIVMLLGIVAALTICNWLIRKMKLEFILGK